MIVQGKLLHVKAFFFLQIKKLKKPCVFLYSLKFPVSKTQLNKNK